MDSPKRDSDSKRSGREAKRKEIRSVQTNRATHSSDDSSSHNHNNNNNNGEKNDTKKKGTGADKWLKRGSSAEQTGPDHIDAARKFDLRFKEVSLEKE